MQSKKEIKIHWIVYVRRTCKISQALEPCFVADGVIFTPNDLEAGVEEGEAVALPVQLPGAAFQQAGRAAVVLERVQTDPQLAHVLVVPDASAAMQGHVQDRFVTETIYSFGSVSAVA